MWSKIFNVVEENPPECEGDVIASDVVDTQQKSARVKDERRPPRHFISESDQNELMLLRDKLTEFAFRIGDIARKYVDGIFSSGQNVTAQEIYAEVGRFCGRSSRTVRYYAETSAFYDKETRDKYHMLSFSHFVLARSHGEDWEIVLNLAAEKPEISVEDLERRLRIAADRGVLGDKNVPEEMREISPIYAGASLADALMYDELRRDADEVIMRAFGVPPEMMRNFTPFQANLDVAEVIGGFSVSLARFERWLQSTGELDDDNVKTAIVACEAMRGVIEKLRVKYSGSKMS